MIDALRRLQESSNPQPMPDEMSAFGISGAGVVKELYSTHPPLEVRIKALEEAG
jgi:heat shock protein HtpX